MTQDSELPSTLLERNLEGLRAYVRIRLGKSMRTKETSLDLVQSVCREVLQDLDNFEYRGEGGFRNWLFRHAENKIRDRARFWHRDKRSIDRETAPAPGAEVDEDGDLIARLESIFTPSRHAVAKEELLRLGRVFDRLPPDYAEVIALARVQGLTHEEIAARMGRTTSATRTLLSRALARLGTELESDDEQS